MPIQIEVVQEGAGVIYDCRGAVTISDFYQATKSFLATPEEVKKWRYTIIDLTFADSMDIDYREIETVVALDRQLAAFAIPGVLLAVASPSDLGYGLARMWEAIVDGIGWETRVFRSRSEAECWVKERAKKKFGFDVANPSSAPGQSA